MSSPTPIPRRLWRSAGLFVLAYVASFLASIAIVGPPTVLEGRSALVEHSWSEEPLGQVFTGGYVLLLGHLCLMVALAFLVRALGRRGEVGGWAARVAAGAGVFYVMTIVVGGFAPGAAALWGRDNGGDLATLLTVNDIRNFAYFIALPVMGTCVLAIATAALQDRVLTRWTGWFGAVVGVALLLTAPAAAFGVQFGMPLMLLWWLGVGISLLRHQPLDETRPADPSDKGARPDELVRHA